MMNDQENIRVWKNSIYQLQQEAPTPIPVKSAFVLHDRPPQYGEEYHGAISREEIHSMLLRNPTGSYVIRSSQRGENAFTLAFKFDDEIKYYKLYYDAPTCQHYVGEKRFDTTYDLVADGLIHLYIETRGKSILEKIGSASNYESSPYYLARYHTIQARTQNLRRAAARRDSRHIHHHHNQQSPVLRRQSIDSGILFGTTGSSPPVPASVVSSNQGSYHHLSQGGCHTPSSHHQLPPPVPPHANNSASSSPLQHFQTTGSAGSSTDSIASPAVAPRRRHSKDDFLRLANQSPLTDASSNSGTTNSDNLAHILLDNNNQRLSPRDLLLASAGSRRCTVDGSGGSPAVCSPGSKEECDRGLGGKLGRASTKSAAQTLMERYNLPCEEVDVSRLEKKHNLRVHTFKGPHWCDFCTHFMWGLVAQGVKCLDCGFQAHKKCSERAPPDCLPDLKRLKRVFGVELTGLVKAENRSVPQVLVKCITEIERRKGLEVEGLYRVAGFHDHVEDIKLSFDRGGPNCDAVDISPTRYEDITILTSVVKLFLRELPIPLITYDTYNDFIDAVKRDNITLDERIDLLSEVLCKLPPAHYQTLKYVVAHLYRVSAQCDVNKMSPDNLAIVLAPTILTSPDGSPMTSLMNAQSERSIIQYLIIHYYDLFT